MADRDSWGCALAPSEERRAAARAASVDTDTDGAELAELGELEERGELAELAEDYGDAWDVACPFCDADPGAPCVTTTGKVRDEPHADRADAAGDA